MPKANARTGRVLGFVRRFETVPGLQRPDVPELSGDGGEADGAAWSNERGEDVTRVD
ncbi:MAG: hypothetical protein LC749_10985 [Actinobacteria bacterium]|nr:hypothetical protein [Actinomycetota bacterium]